MSEPREFWIEETEGPLGLPQYKVYGWQTHAQKEIHVIEYIDFNRVKAERDELAALLKDRDDDWKRIQDAERSRDEWMAMAEKLDKLMKACSGDLDGIKYELEASVYTLTDYEYGTVFFVRDQLDRALAEFDKLKLK